MIYYVDIDGTICDGQPYEIAVVMPDRVDKINKLFDEGHTIVYWTATRWLGRKASPVDYGR